MPITRLEGTFEDGARTLQARFARGSAPSPPEQLRLETPLKNGDTITAAPQYYVTVDGEVTRPGRYAIEGEVTVSRVVSTAGGRTRMGGKKVRVRRIDPHTGSSQVLDLDLKAVEEGKKPDLLLLPNDAVSVEPRGAL